MAEKPSKYEAGTKGENTTSYTRTNIDSPEVPKEAVETAEDSKPKRGRR